MNKLPERINAMKTITYDTQHYLADVALQNDVEEDEVTTQMLIDWIEDWMYEDFGGDVTGVILQDENGDVL
jgi:predicted transglutaminase-like protease